MADIPYLSPGHSLSAADWNTLYVEADRKLGATYGSLAIPLWGDRADPVTGVLGSFLFKRRFYFFDALPSEPYANIAQAWIGQLYTAISGSLRTEDWFRKYDHSVFTTFVTDCVLGDAGPGGRPVLATAYPCARVKAPADMGVWHGLVNPAGAWWPPGGVLAGSLEAHKKTYTPDGGSPQDFYLYVEGDDEAQRQNLWTPIEVILGDGVGATFTWPSNYDKYQFIRFSNLQDITVAITLPGHTFNLGPLRSRCVRRVYGVSGWSELLDYFFYAYANDPWFAGWADGQNSNVTDPTAAAYLVPNPPTRVDGALIYGRQLVDHSKLWNAASLYNVAAGGNAYWPLEPTTAVGDFLVNRGQVMVIDPADPAGRTALNFLTFDSLITLLAGAGITVTNPSPANAHGFRLTCASAIDLVDYSSNLCHQAGLPGYSFGVGINVEFPALTLDPNLVSLTLSTVTHTDTWYDGLGANTVTWTNKVWLNASTTAPTAFSYFDSLQDIWDAWEAWATNLTNTYGIISTAFGHWLTVSQTRALDYPGSGIDLSGYFELSYNDPNWSLLRNSAVPLACTRAGTPVRRDDCWWNFYLGGTGSYENPGAFAVFGQPSYIMGNRTVSALLACTARIPRAWASWRWFGHDPTAEPWFSGSTTTQEEPLVHAWYEVAPFPTWDGPMPLLLPLGGINIKNGLYRPGLAWGAGGFASVYDRSDNLTRFAAWLNFARLDWQTALGAGSIDFAAGSGAQATYWGDQRGHVLSGLVGDDNDLVFANLTPIQVEHYNAIASSVNAITGMVTGPPVGDAQSYIANELFGTIGRGIGSLNYRPRTQYASWDNVSNPSATTFWSGHGATVKTASDFPAAWATMAAAYQLYVWDDSGTITTGELAPGMVDRVSLWSQWGLPDPSTLSNYRWVTIADAQAVFADLGLPFVMEELAVPAKLLQVDATCSWAVGKADTWGSANFARAAMFVNDLAAGDWVFDPDAQDDDGYNVIRASVARCDYVLYAGPDAIKIDFGGTVETRLYDGLAIRPCQGIHANKAYLWRRYGGPEVKVVIFPRNYADYARDTGAPQLSWITRTAKTTIEASAPEVVDGTADEVEITTGLEHAVLQVWRTSRVL